jgi:hypothetical protein
MNISNRQTILLFSLSTLMMNGCISKHEIETISTPRVMTHAIQTQSLAQTKSGWGNVKHVMNKTTQSKVACVNCYASPSNYSRKRFVAKRGFSRSIKKPSIISYSYYDAPVDYSTPPSAFRDAYKTREKKVSSLKHYGRYTYTEKPEDKMLEREHYTHENSNKYLLPVVSSMNNAYSSYDSFPTYSSSNTSIQVGAFRKYSGAKRYVRRYSALSNKYRVVIKTGTKGGRPIYRVRIEGFKNQREARNFMNVYGIQDAFLVRR